MIVFAGVFLVFEILLFITLSLLSLLPPDSESPALIAKRERE